MTTEAENMEEWKRLLVETRLIFEELDIDIMASIGVFLF